MSYILTQQLIYEILSVVDEVPIGYAATYGQIAALIGRPKNSRLVGTVLSKAALYGDFPCHRIVNSNGRLAPGWPQQRMLLEAEGVSFKTNGCVDLKKHQWSPL